MIENARQLVGPALYVLLWLGLVLAILAVREEFDRIRRVRHWLAVMGEEEQR